MAALRQEVSVRLAGHGHRVTTIEQLPSGGHDPAALGDLGADAEYLRDVIAEAPGDVVLVGHSYGGMAVTELADHPRVRHSVYITAFWPGKGESLMEIRSEHERQWVIYREDGVLQSAPPAPVGPGGRGRRYSPGRDGVKLSAARTIQRPFSLTSARIASTQDATGPDRGFRRFSSGSGKSPGERGR
jgi:pimeloyl-ACP methyl ester carboxylesterase